MVEKDCYAYRVEGEPTFTLLARDPDFREVVMFWAKLRLDRIRNGDKPQTDETKVYEAMALANEAVRWRGINAGVWRNQGKLGV